MKKNETTLSNTTRSAGIRDSASPAESEGSNSPSDPRRDPRDKLHVRGDCGPNRILLRLGAGTACKTTGAPVQDRQTLPGSQRCGSRIRPFGLHLNHACE